MFNNYIIWAFLSGIFTFSITSLGSALVLLFKNNNKGLSLMISLSAGIMLSATFFSLLEPAITYTNNNKLNIWLYIVFGFLLGCFFLFICNIIIRVISNKRYPNLHNIKRSIMLFSSITIHNIPEGLLLGIAFGTLSYSNTESNLLSALTLTLAIAIQNFPEGSAISLPLRKEGFSRLNAFLFGSLSAIVEPIFAFVGAILVIKIQVLLPFIMSFAAGAMIFVTISELIPEALSTKNSNISTFFITVGFIFMLILEMIT